VKVRRGETEYGIGAIPLGGYVKISGMNPQEPLPEEVRPRAYYNQPVWKRVVVIAAGPAVNLVLAFVILWALFLVNGAGELTHRIDSRGLEPPASTVLRPGDQIVSVDGKRGSQATISQQIASHRCAGAPTPGCRAASPVRVVVKRNGRPLTFSITPRYDTKVKRMRIGFAFHVHAIQTNPLNSARLSADTMWQVTKGTVAAIVRIFQPEQRKQLSSVVGASKVTEQAFGYGISDALRVLAIISLSLALINLFPFLPLDGGHIFWAAVEKLRGRPVPFTVMERASVIGFALVLMLFFIGLSNDIGRLRGEGFRVR
jgi:regulator of sigma E protease